MTQSLPPSGTDDAALVARLQALPTQRQPAPQLWENIAAALPPRDTVAALAPRRQRRATGRSVRGGTLQPPRDERGPPGRRSARAAGGATRIAGRLMTRIVAATVAVLLAVEVCAFALADRALVVTITGAALAAAPSPVASPYSGDAAARTTSPASAIPTPISRRRDAEGAGKRARPTSQRSMPAIRPFDPPALISSVRPTSDAFAPLEHSFTPCVWGDHP